MFPHEAQEMMAKILFFVFASLVISFSRVNACELKQVPTFPTEVSHNHK